jgi:hypothetical protein
MERGATVSYNSFGIGSGWMILTGASAFRNFRPRPQ